MVAITRFVGIRPQRLGDQVLGHLGAVRVGGVDQVDAALDEVAEQRAGGGRIGRFAPDAGAGDPHRAEAEAPDLEVAAEEEGVAVGHRARAYRHPAAYDLAQDRMARQPPMLIPLGYGKFVRADRVFALVPLEGADRGDGRRTLVYVEGIEEPIIASRSEGAIARDVAGALGRGGGRLRDGAEAARPRSAVLRA